MNDCGFGRLIQAMRSLSISALSGWVLSFLKAHPKKLLLLLVVLAVAKVLRSQNPLLLLIRLINFFNSVVPQSTTRLQPLLQVQPLRPHSRLMALLSKEIDLKALNEQCKAGRISLGDMAACSVKLTVAKLLAHCCSRMLSLVTQTIASKYAFKFQYLGFEQAYRHTMQQLCERLGIVLFRQLLSSTASFRVKGQPDFNANADQDAAVKIMRECYEQVLSASYRPKVAKLKGSRYDYLFEELGLDPQHQQHNITNFISKVTNAGFGLLFPSTPVSFTQHRFSLLEALAAEARKCSNDLKAIQKCQPKVLHTHLDQRQAAADLFRRAACEVGDLIESHGFGCLLWEAGEAGWQVVRNRLSTLLQRRGGLSLLSLLGFSSRVVEEQIVSMTEVARQRYYEREFKRIYAETWMQDMTKQDFNRSLLNEMLAVRRAEAAEGRFAQTVYYERLGRAGAEEGLGDLLKGLGQVGITDSLQDKN